MLQRLVFIEIIRIEKLIIFVFFQSNRRAERHPGSVVVRNTHQFDDVRRPYATRAAPQILSDRGRKQSISVINLNDSSSPMPTEFFRPRRTTRSASPSNSFRYILPFNSQREQKRRSVEGTSLGNRQEVPITTVTESPMYRPNEYF